MNMTGPETPPRAANPTSQPYALLPYQPPARPRHLNALVPDHLVFLAPCPLWLGPLGQHLWAAVPSVSFLTQTVCTFLPDLNCAGSLARRSKRCLSWRCLSHQCIGD